MVDMDQRTTRPCHCKIYLHLLAWPAEATVSAGGPNARSTRCLAMDDPVGRDRAGPPALSARDLLLAQSLRCRGILTSLQGRGRDMGNG